jgi:hypothetical protein
LSAVRSAIKSSAAGPRAVSSGARWPSTRAPSATWASTAMRGSTITKIAAARSRPNTVSGTRAFITATAVAPVAPTVDAVVTSPRPRSSSSASSIRRRTCGRRARPRIDIAASMPAVVGYRHCSMRQPRARA